MENSSENQSKNTETILTGSGISYAQIPRNIFKLTEIKSLTASDVLLALKMFDYCHSKRKYPKFKISHTELAQITSMSRRQVMYGLDRLIDLQVIVARIEAGKVNEYQWNGWFLQTGELASAKSAHVPVQKLHKGCEKSAHVPVQNLHHIYIEFILDYFYKLYREYFTAQEYIKVRVPPKRGQPKDVAKDFATHYYANRTEVWKEAIEEAIKKGGYARTYVALAGGFNIDQVAYPKAYLKKLIWDESHQWESKKKSHLFNNGHLDSDEDFFKFISERRKRDEPVEEIEFEEEIEMNYVDSGEVIYE